MSADGDTVREALIECGYGKHSDAAFAALSRLEAAEADRDEWKGHAQRLDMLRLRDQAQRDALAEALRRYARAALAEAGL